jgi:putative transposase
MILFNNKYRVESTRLKGWDYTNSGMYYITICTANMKKFFGNIKNGEVDLSNEGKIVEEEWEDTSIKRSNVILDEFIVMPNHFHGIIALEKINFQSTPETSQRDVCTGSMKQGNSNQKLTANSLGSIINQFKGKCTKRIRKFHDQFKWHCRFHDRIIRNEKELDNIRAYIHYNPMKWDTDEFFRE